MSFIRQYRIQLKQHTIGTLLLSALILFTVLLVILRLSLSAIIILSTEKWLASQQLEANIERLEISLFSGRVSLHNAEAQNAQQQGFKIGELTLDWDWLPLFSKQVEINEITLRDFSIDAELHRDGGLNLGGIKLPANQADSTKQEQTKETAQAKPGVWQATVRTIELNNIDVCVAQLDQDNQPLMDYCSQLEQLNWQGQIAYLPETTTVQDTSAALAIYADGDFNLQMLKLHNKLLQLDLLTIAEINLPQLKIESMDSIQLKALDIKQLALLQQATDKTTEQTAKDTHINHLLAFTSLQLGPVGITQNRKFSLGDITLSGLRSRAPVRSDNQLDIADWIPEAAAQPTDQPVDTGITTETENLSKINDSLPENERQKSSNNNIDEKTIHLQINNIRLDDSRLCTDHAGNSRLKPLVYCMVLDNAHWQGTLAYGKQNDKNEDTGLSSLSLYANGDFTISQLHIKNHSLNLNLLSVDDVRLEEIKIKTTEHIDIAALTIEQLSSFERDQKNRDDTGKSQPSYIFSFQHFSMLPVKFSTDEVVLGTIKITGSQAYIVINQQGEAELTQWHVQPAVTENTQKTEPGEKPQATTDQIEAEKEITPASSTTADKLQFSLDKLIFHTEKKTTFIDQSTPQQMKLVIELIDFQLKNIDSTASDRQSSASLLIRLEDQATLKLDAQGTPLADNPDIKGNGSISALDLRSFSPIVRKQLGRSIRSGQLDAEMDINVKQGHADSLLDLKLRHFVLRTLNEEEAERLDKNLGFPLNTSLNLLRDKDNKIHLSIPITQDVDNLDVDIKPVIYKALSRSVSSAIVNYYTPFGLVFVAESLFDLATALKFKPVLFNPGEAALTEASKTELEKLATIMNERPGIHLTLCGFSNLNDIPQENAKTANQPASEKIEISAAQRQQLLQLAGSRSSVVKQYLINMHQISASRLVECEAEYAADAIAGVEIKL